MLIQKILPLRCVDQPNSAAEVNSVHLLWELQSIEVPCVDRIQGLSASKHVV